MKILNLYAGIGGNRKLWGDSHEVTAVENNQSIADIYRLNFPKDVLIIGDAKEYLLKHFQEFDFIWASPPCPTHSRMRNLWKGDYNFKNKKSGQSFKLPDMDLYSIIIFLKHFYTGKWVVENVVSYYDPLIEPYIADNHYFWSNFTIRNISKQTRAIKEQDLNKKIKRIELIIPNNLNKRFERKLINNCVTPKVGLSILNDAINQPQKTLLSLQSPSADEDTEKEGK